MWGFHARTVTLLGSKALIEKPELLSNESIGAFV
jgi:hypothetical protein